MNDILKIKDYPENERPQERLVKYGADNLSNSELLAIILRTGTKNENIMMLTNRLIKENKSLNGIFNQSIEELMKTKGIGIVKASQIVALSEIFKRINSFKSGEEFKINNSKNAVDLVMNEMKDLKQETLKVLMLNTKNIVICAKDVFIGTLNFSIAHPREIFCEAIKKNSAAIIVCHNHPSGDSTPSREDITTTLRLKKCSELIGIHLLDHIIIGNNNYVSLNQKGII